METLRDGDGATFPQIGDTVTFHYSLTVGTDPTVIYDTRPTNKPLVWELGFRGEGGAVIGFNRAVAKMSKGQRAKLTIPPELAYGTTGGTQYHPPIPPNSTIIIDVEFLNVVRFRRA